MQYHDHVYGSTEIGEPVFQSLIRSKAMARLRGVLQHGISGLVGVTAPITRFEHSVGTMLLVRRLGGNLAEQVAALLHDVSHTAFSHVIDYVFDGHGSQSYHDEIKEQYVSRTDIPELLARYGFHWQEFMDEKRFPLLEQPAPRLCADRIDYFLRDSLELDLATPQDVQNVLERLVVHDGRIVVDSLPQARWLAYTYLEADKASWANFREVALYELTARAIRRALEIGFVQVSDFWQTDEALWQQLRQADDPEIQRELALVNRRTRFRWDEENPTFLVSTKLRSIDPDVLQAGGRLAPLSSIDDDFAAERRAYHRQRDGLWPVRVVGAQDET